MGVTTTVAMPLTSVCRGNYYPCGLHTALSSVARAAGTKLFQQSDRCELYGSLRLTIVNQRRELKSVHNNVLLTSTAGMITTIIKLLYMSVGTVVTFKSARGYHASVPRSRWHRWLSLETNMVDSLLHLRNASISLSLEQDS